MKHVSTHILKLISSYTTKEISQAEFNALQLWLNEAAENKQLFSDYLQFYKKSRQLSLAQSIDKDKAWHTIVSQLHTPLMAKTKQRKSKVEFPGKPWSKYAAAAVLVIALASTYFLRDTIFNGNIETTTPIIVNNMIEPGTDKATLTLENGEQVTLEKGTQFQTQNATSNGEEITYLPAGRQGNKSTSRELVNNYLTIPRGGQFQMTLSDGTRVWLNSETQLKYPVSFTDGESRQVELVYGEAYFDVSPSTEHSGANFKVFNNNQEVEVLGTEFNIKAYKDETNIYTTLVEGKVAISTADTNQILAPNQQSSLDLKNNKISIATVDVHNETSWKEGVFDFTKMPLKDIMKVLSRWYDMDVIFVNKNLEDIIFTGKFNKSRSTEDILLAIKNTNIINNYEINNKTIIIY
jgi:ferric-dicitrate binding protein FerR (iron transport regulator)